MLGKKSIQYKEVNGKVAFIIKFRFNYKRFTFFYESVIRGQVKLFIFFKKLRLHISKTIEELSP